MKTFEELKLELLEKAKAVPACSDQYKRALSANTPEELLKVVYDNLGWCISNECITNAWLESFPSDVLLASGCANSGKENTGFVNSGDSNSGNWNSGDSNSGDSNSGNWNSGNSNSGDSNSGDSNSGYRNSGNWNSGNCNSGNWNSGDSNSGYRNSGNWNSGNRNSGDSNSGYRNSGAFCTDHNPKAILFNKESTLTIKEWEKHPACILMYNIDPTIWVPDHMMTEEEKAAHPLWKTTEGYLKTIPMKEAWANFWGNLSEENKQHFYSIPNFDASIFEEITGIKI